MIFLSKWKFVKGDNAYFQYVLTDVRLEEELERESYWLGIIPGEAGLSDKKLNVLFIYFI